MFQPPVVAGRATNAATTTKEISANVEYLSLCAELLNNQILNSGTGI
jgi:hypothetical protein